MIFYTNVLDFDISLSKLKNLVYICRPQKWSRGRVVRQRSAKPCTAVRIRPRPQKVFIFDEDLFRCTNGFGIPPDSDESVPSLPRSVYDLVFLLRRNHSVLSATSKISFVVFSFALSRFGIPPDSNESVPSLPRSVYDLVFLLHRNRSVLSAISKISFVVFSFALSRFGIPPDSDESVPSLSRSVYDLVFLLHRNRSVMSAILKDIFCGLFFCSVRIRHPARF